MTGTPRLLASLAPAALAATIACGCVSVDVTGMDVSSVCVVDVEIYFMPASEGETIAVSEALLDAGENGVEVPENGTIILDNAVFFAVSGIADFGFAESITVEIQPDLVLVDETIVAPASPLTLRGRPGTDIAPALRGGEVLMGVEVRGDLPDEPWSVTADLCFDVENLEDAIEMP